MTNHDGHDVSSSAEDWQNGQAFCGFRAEKSGKEQRRRDLVRGDDVDFRDCRGLLIRVSFI